MTSIFSKTTRARGAFDLLKIILLLGRQDCRRPSPAYAGAWDVVYQTVIDFPSLSIYIESMLRLLTRFSKKEYFFIIIAVALIAFGVYLDLLLPEYTAKIMSIVSTKGEGTPLPDGSVQGQGTMSDVWRLGLTMLGFTLGSVFITVIVSLIAARVSSAFASRLRKHVFEKVSGFSSGEMKQFSVSSLITRSTNDVTQVRMFVGMGIQLLVKAPITAVWAILKITNKSWELSAITTIAVITLMIMIVFIIFMVLPRYRKIQTLTDRLTQVTRENLTGIRVVRAYNAEQFQESKFEKANDTLTRNNLFTYRALGIMMPFMQLLMSGMALAVWWTSAILMNKGTMAPTFAPQVMEFNQYSFQIIFSFMMLVMIFVMMPRVTVSGRRIQEVLKVVPAIMDGKGVPDLASGGEVEFRNVCFKYPDAERHVLDDINIKIKTGQTVAFIGSTGSGKSTLVNLVPRLYDATEGEILLNGVDIREYTLEQLHDIVGYIPQRAVVFAGTIASNIAFGTVHGKAICESEITRALEVAQATDFVSQMKDGINSEVSQGGKNLSGGQRQRLAIARVVARHPKVFIFDDTFGALDYKTDKALREALKQECAGVTVLIVAQRIGTIMDADQIVVLDKGKIIGIGTHKQLLGSCEIYKEIAFSQLSKEELYE